MEPLDKPQRLSKMPVDHVHRHFHDRKAQRIELRCQNWDASKISSMDEDIL
jgi:hypothetical protein